MNAADSSLRRWSRIPFFGLFVYLGFYLLPVCVKFPWETIFYARSFADTEYPSMVLYAQISRNFWLTDGHFWGYLTQFNAGSHFSFLGNNKVFYHLFGNLFPSASLVRILGIYLFLIVALFPPIVASAGWILRLPPRARSTLLAFASLAFSMDVFMYLMRITMPASILAMALSVPLMAVVFRTLQSPTWGRHAVTALLVALGLLVHKAAGMAMVFLLPQLLLVQRPVRPGRWLLGSLLALGFALLVNAFWLVPMLRYLDYRTLMPDVVPVIETGWRAIVLPVADLLLPMQGRVRLDVLYWPIGPWKLLHASLALFGWLHWRRTDRPAARAWLAAWIGLLAWVYGLSLLRSCDALYVQRLAPLTRLMLALPAAIGWAVLWNSTSTPRTRARAAAVLALVLTLPSTWVHFGIAMPRALSAEEERLAERIQQRWIAEIDTEDRILYEQTDVHRQNLPPLYDMLAPIFPITSGRAFATPPYPYQVTVYNHPQYRSGSLENRPMSDYGPAEMRALLDTYNVGWIVYWSKESVKWFERHPEICPDPLILDDAPEYRLCRVPDPAGYTLQGTAEVTWSVNRIHVRNAHAEGGALVLRYHYFRDLACEPDCRIERYPIEGDPVGFIRVPDPPGEFTIRVDFP